ncbi:MAG: hypothetical protein ABI604_13620, partial [Nitrospirota bacterium]
MLGFSGLVHCLFVPGAEDQSGDRFSSVWEIREVIAMKRNRQCQCVMFASVLVMIFGGGLSQAQDTDSVSRTAVMLPELI